MNKIITRIVGGLGNQLFCYAVARRMALINNAELVIDHVSGFARDYQYHRRYMLDRFYIPARKATLLERMEPLERYRRGVMKYLSRKKPFIKRRYVEQEGPDFDERVLALKIKGTLYLDGCWQSEDYFKDTEQVIRDELRIIPPTDALNLRVSEEICKSSSVALHVRWFDSPEDAKGKNILADYYRRAVSLMEEKVNSPHYFLFSDNPEAARANFSLSDERITCVTHNRGEENAHADLWLMSQCKNFIIANSTFSWWGAWLCAGKEKIVMTPDIKIDGKWAWGFKGLIPAEWLKISVLVK